MSYLYFSLMVEIKGKNNTLERTLMHIMIIFSLLIIMKLNLHYKYMILPKKNCLLNKNWLKIGNIWLHGDHGDWCLHDISMFRISWNFAGLLTSISRPKCPSQALLTGQKIPKIEHYWNDSQGHMTGENINGSPTVTD